MNVKVEIPRLRPEPQPKMMDACQSGGCGGGAPAPRRPPPPVFSEVSVNGVRIDPDAIAAEIQHHPAPDADAAWRSAARALAVRELLLQRAHALGLEPEAEADETGRREVDDEALICALLERDVIPEEPGREACRRFYDANTERFRTPDLFEASHILIAPDGDTPEAWSAAGSELRGISAEIGNDATAFAAAAREFSACPTGQQDGSLGQVRRGELVPEVQAALEALTPGTATRRPVRSRHGWHALRLARVIEGQVLPFEAVEEKITDLLAARSWTMQAARYVATLAEAAEVEGVAIEPEEQSA